MLKKVCLISFFLISNLVFFGQNDSLTQIKIKKVNSLIAKSSFDDIELGIGYLKKAKNIINHSRIDLLTKDTLLCKVDYNLAMFYYHSKQEDSTILFCKSAIKSSKKLNYIERQNVLNTLLVGIYNSLSKFDSSYIYLKKSEILFEIDSVLKKSTNYMYHLSARADLFLQIGDYDKALQEEFKILELSKEIKPPNISSVYGGIGQIYLLINDYDNALIFYKRSLLDTTNTLTYNVTNFNENLGYIYALNNELDSSLFHYKQAFKNNFDKNLGKKAFNQLLLRTLVDLYLNSSEEDNIKNPNALLGKLTKYIIDSISKPRNFKEQKYKIYNSSVKDNNIRLFISLIDVNYLPEGFNAKSDYYYCLAKIDTSYQNKISYANIALSHIGMVSFFNKRVIYNFLYDLYKKNGDKEKAFQALEKVNSLQNSIEKKDKTLAVQKIFIEDILNKKNKEIISNEIDFKKKHKLKKQTIFGLVLLLFILLILFVLLYMRHKKKKNEYLLSEKGSVELDKANKTIRKDLVKASLEFEKDKRFIEQTKKQLKEIKKASSNNQNINELYVNVNLYVNQKNPQLEEKIKLISDSFFDELDKVGKLTKTEKKVSGLLTLDLSSKEIANLLNLSERSVETYRSNIRKKLNISKNKSLGVFFKSL
jgi:DNA-binding CsgD family transcriptional regulator